MIVDLHLHYPMRVVQDLTPATADHQVRKLPDHLSLGERAQRLFIGLLAKFMNDRDPGAGYRVTFEGLRASGVGVALSVLYRPLEEMDLSEHYGAPPQPGYYPLLLRDLEEVEREVAAHGPALIRVARTMAEVDAARAAGAIALVHCVEGGFHVGDTPEHIAANVAELAGRGVAYITVAHLFYRGVAANAPALPFMVTDENYNTVFPQDASITLTALGEALVRAMVANGILIDLSHMRSNAIVRTLDLLDEIDPGGTVPVLSSHAGYRFGTQDYMLDDDLLQRVARRDGVVGLIMAQYQLNDGLFDGHTSTFEETKTIVFSHVDRIVEVTGGFDHVGIGSDLDGFIRPTATGIEGVGDLAALEVAVRERYGDERAERLLNGNALRVLRAGWGRTA